MVHHTCANCGRVFLKKQPYNSHLSRKTPCKKPLTTDTFVEPTTEFSENSSTLNKQLSKDTRKSEGIFFTPFSARKRLFEVLDTLHVSPKTILEPSFGSGEFLMDLYKRYPKSTVYGVEKNTTLFNSVPRTKTLYNEDFLEYTSKPVDLIVGNPPYLTVKTKQPECMTGRGNIYIQFLYKCLTQHLKLNGILAFILPTSLYNSSYYEPCRRYISENVTILHLETLDVTYYETTQPTILIVIKNCKLNNDYIFEYLDNKYITPFYKELYDLTKNTVTLKSLGFSVKTGDVVWNQEKDKLSNDGTLVIYSSNIVDNTLVLNNLTGEKKQYIREFKNKPTKGPAILVSRGYGNSYRFSFVVVNDIEFHGENHINVISPNNNDSDTYIDKIKKSFESDKTSLFIKYFVGNGALSKSELENLPIFED